MSGETAIRVVLGEDSFLAREGIVRALERADGVELVGVCSDLPSLRDTVEAQLPDVVLTDIRMPPTKTDEGLQIASELRATHPDIGVVILSQHAEGLYAMDLFEGGVERRGYLLKEQVKDGEELSRALKTVAAGGSYVDASVIGPLIVRGYQSHWLLEHLTSRELDILRLVAEGHSNAGIAAITGITVRGVERHVNGIFAKLGLSEDADINRRVKAAIMYLSSPPTG